MTKVKQPTVYGLYQWNQSPNAIEMIAPSQAAARTMATMFGRGRWKIRKLTAAEVADPSVQAEIAALTERGVWHS